MVALLLLDTKFEAAKWSMDDVINTQNEILSRIRGTNGATGTQIISAILNEFVLSKNLRRGTDLAAWIDSATGIDSVFSLQHAIDYVHFIDGNAVSGGCTKL